ncbi:MAG: EAL domain-containing protein, partial [Solirubrobacteraceae bacterium]
MASAAAALGAVIGGREHSIERLIRERAVHSAYQPLVDLYTGETIGFEALARGPLASGLERPDQLFAAAKRAGCERELDWECQRAAVEGGLAAGLDGGRALFVNVEPSLTGERPGWLAELLAQASARFPIFVEFTERALTDRPAELLRAARWLRAQGLGIALDDVGADARSLALMPVLAPDVIKLDLRLVQARPSREIAAILHAVNAEAERTGAQLLAEGIETEEHRRTALALGARYGQGWLFGRPGALVVPAAPAQGGPARHERHPAMVGATPFELVSAQRETRCGT